MSLFLMFLPLIFKNIAAYIFINIKMNFLKGIASNIKQQKKQLTQNYLRNADSKVLKSSEFKNLVPFVRIDNFHNDKIVGKKDDPYCGWSRKLTCSCRPVRLSILQRWDFQSIYLEVHVLFQEHLLWKYQWEECTIRDWSYKVWKVLVSQI